MTDSFDGRGSHLAKHWPVYGIILPLATILRLAYFTTYGFWFDEGSSLHIAGRLFEPGLFTKGYAASESPLWISVLRLWMVVDDSELWIKLLPLVLGVASVMAAYAAVYRFFDDKKPAFFVSVMVAVSPIHVYYAHELRTLTMYILLAFSSLYFFARLIDEERDLAAACGYVLTSAATFYAHYVGLLWVAALGLAYLVAAWPDRRRITRWIGLNIVIAALFIPGLWCSFVVARIYRSGEPFTMNPLWISPAITVKNLVVGYTSVRWVYVSAVLVAAWLGLRSAAVMFRDGEYRKLVILVIGAAFMPATVFAMSYLTGTSAYVDRYFLPAALPMYMLMAVGALRGHTCRPRLRTAAFMAAPVFLMIMGLPAVWSDALHPSIHHRPSVRYKIDNRGAAAYIAENHHEGDVVGHASHVTLMPFLHYLPDESNTHLCLTDDDIDGLLAGYPFPEAMRRSHVFPERVQALLNKPSAERLWLVVSWWEPFRREDAPERVLAWCDSHLRVIEHKAFRGIDVYLFENDFRGTTKRLARTVDGTGPVDVYDARDMSSGEPAVPSPLRTAYRGGWASGSTTYLDAPPNTENARVIVRPESPGMHTYEYTVYGTAQLVEASSFLKRRWNSDVWTVNVVHNPAPPPATYMDTCLSASIDREGPASGDVVTRLLAVPAGRYTFYVRVMLEGDRDNHARAGLHVAVNGQELPMLDCCVATLRAGWYWVRLGTVDLVGDGPHVMAMRASNPSNLTKAYLDIDKVALVRSEEVAVGPRVASPPVLADGIVTGKPDSPPAIVIPGPGTLPSTDQIDCFVTDRGTGHVYRIFYRDGLF